MRKNYLYKYSQNLLDHAKQSATDAFKTALKRAIQETAEATSDLMGKNPLIKLQKSWKLYHKIVQGQLQMKQKILNMIKKYQKNINHW